MNFEEIKKRLGSIILCFLSFFGSWYALKYVPFERNGKLIGGVLFLVGILFIMNITAYDSFHDNDEGA